MDESLIREQEVQLQKTGRYYKHICFMAVPVLWMACFLYGVRPLLLCGIAVLTGNLCDRLVSLLRRRVYQAGDFSNESFALVIALLMPVTVDIYVLIIAVLAGVLIGKEIFGGYGSYPFNPAAVGYVVAAVSWPEQVFRYPQPYTSIPLWDASMVPVSSTIEDTLRSGGMLNIRSLVLSLGEYAAPMGTGAALVILACGQPFTDAAQQHQQQSIAHGDAQALGNGLAHRLLYAAETVGQQRLHREHGQIDAKAQQAGTEQHVQDGVHRQIHHSGAEAVHQCTGQQLFLQRFRGRVLVVQGHKAAQQAGQHAGGHQQQRHRHRQHHRILAAGGACHQRGQTHALHDHRVIQEHTVVVGKLVGIFYDQFSRCASHCAAPFPASACRWVR